MKVCSLLFKKGSISSRNSPLFPILGNPCFTPGHQEVQFKQLMSTGCTQASHFLKQKKWPILQELINPTGTFQLKFWNAIQITHFFRSLPPPHKFDQPLTTLEEICSTEGTLPHTLSCMYNLLITPPDTYSLKQITDWERDLNYTFSSQQKQRIIQFTYKSSICTRTQETNFKILTRWYRTPEKLSKIFPTSSDRCWRCH